MVNFRSVVVRDQHKIAKMDSSVLINDHHFKYFEIVPSDKKCSLII